MTLLKLNATIMCISTCLEIAMSADSLLFVKSHVNAFTRKDGTFVAAHDDKRTAASVTAAQGSDKPNKRVVSKLKKPSVHFYF